MLFAGGACDTRRPQPKRGRNCLRRPAAAAAAKSCCLRRGNTLIARETQRAARVRAQTMSSTAPLAWSPDADALPASLPPAEVIRRIERDLLDVFRAPLPGVLVVPSDDVRVCFALLVGPADTPYFGAPVVFKLRFPNECARRAAAARARVIACENGPPRNCCARATPAVRAAA